MKLDLISLKSPDPSNPGLSYQKVFEYQQELVQKRIHDEIGDTLLLLEHSPVITRGSGLQDKTHQNQMPLGELPKGIEYIQTNRGGDLTYHGPGQLVGYPICKLGAEEGWYPKRDIHGFIRQLESLLIDLLAQYQVEAHSKPGSTGVWIGKQKIASIGIAIKKWVTYHGFAINIVNSLKDFSSFNPCGFQPKVMTRLQDHIQTPFEHHWREEVESHLKHLTKSKKQQTKTDQIFPQRSPNSTAL